MELQELLSVPVAQKTKTYAPVSNLDIHNAIIENANINGFDISNVNVKSKNGRNCIVMYGLQDLKEANPDPEIGIRVGFKNSYDKTVSFGFALGSEVFICSNGMVTGEYTIKKQHRQNDLDVYVKELIKEYFTQVRDEHYANVRLSKNLRKESVNETQVKQIIGDLFINNKIVNQSQLRLMTNQIYTSEKFANLTNNDTITAWDLYNHGTEALKTSANGNFFAKHVQYNEYFKQYFGICD